MGSRRACWMVLGVLALFAAGRSPRAIGQVQPGSPSKVFQEAGGVVSMEAEHATAKGKWKEEGPDSGSSGRYMTATSRRVKSDALRFDIVFAGAGTYWVWLRGLCTSTEDNDCFVSLDGAPAVVKDDGGSWKEVLGEKTDIKRVFGWSNEPKVEKDFPGRKQKRVAVRVGAPGWHTLEIGSRSVGFKIDKVVLLEEGNTSMPAGTGPEETVSAGRR